MKLRGHINLAKEYKTKCSHSVSVLTYYSTVPSLIVKANHPEIINDVANTYPKRSDVENNFLPSLRKNEDKLLLLNRRTPYPTF